LIFQEREGLCAAGCGRDLITLPAQSLRDNLKTVRVVVYD